MVDSWGVEGGKKKLKAEKLKSEWRIGLFRYHLSVFGA